MTHRWTPKDIKAAAVARVVAGDAVSEIARDAGVKFRPDKNGSNTPVLSRRRRRWRTSATSASLTR